MSAMSRTSTVVGPIFLAVTIFIALLAVRPVNAQTLAGTWQGTAGKQRHVLKIVEVRGAFSGTLYSLAFDATANAISSITVTDGEVKFQLDNLDGAFNGSLAQDGKAIEGTWEQFGNAQPLRFALAAAESLWTIDPSPHNTQFVSVAPDVRLEVLDWGRGGTTANLAGGNGQHRARL